MESDIKSLVQQHRMAALHPPVRCFPSHHRLDEEDVVLKFRGHEGSLGFGLPLASNSRRASGPDRRTRTCRIQGERVPGFPNLGVPGVLGDSPRLFFEIVCAPLPLNLSRRLEIPRARGEFRS